MQAATIVALGGLLRNIAAAISAAILDGLVRGMGYGWCFTGLGVLDGVCVVGVGWIMYTARRKGMYRRVDSA